MSALLETSPPTEPLARDAAAEYVEHLERLDASEEKYRADHPAYSPVTERTVEGGPVDDEHESAWLTARRLEGAVWVNARMHEDAQWQFDNETARCDWLTRLDNEGRAWSDRELALNAAVYAVVNDGALAEVGPPEIPRQRQAPADGSPALGERAAEASWLLRRLRIAGPLIMLLSE